MDSESCLVMNTPQEPVFLRTVSNHLLKIQGCWIFLFFKRNCKFKVLCKKITYLSSKDIFNGLPSDISTSNSSFKQKLATT